FCLVLITQKYYTIIDYQNIKCVKVEVIIKCLLGGIVSGILTSLTLNLELLRDHNLNNPYILLGLLFSIVFTAINLKEINYHFSKIILAILIAVIASAAAVHTFIQLIPDLFSGTKSDGSDFLIASLIGCFILTSGYVYIFKIDYKYFSSIVALLLTTIITALSHFMDSGVLYYALWQGSVAMALGIGLHYKSATANKLENFSFTFILYALPVVEILLIAISLIVYFTVPYYSYVEGEDYFGTKSAGVRLSSTIINSLIILYIFLIMDFLGWEKYSVKRRNIFIASFSIAVITGVAIKFLQHPFIDINSLHP
ncbi:MAG: hypothetical protein K2X86_12785, partial [Cytophagaceae bacterium]|nr:hypothetical protein [Cytophagaceae bacterium]